MGDGTVGPVTQRLLAGWAGLTGVDVVAQAMGQLSAEERAELGER